MTDDPTKPPSLLDLIKEAMGRGKKAPEPSTVDPRIYAKVPASFLDTLKAVGGTPRSISYDTTSFVPDLFQPTPALAAYNADSDRMRQTKYGAAKPEGAPTLNPDAQARYAEDPPPDYQLSHEFGHRVMRQGLAPELVKQVLSEDTAYGMDEDERFARNFASAHNRVRATEKVPGITASRLLNETGPRGSEPAIAEWLLEQAVYAQHPAAQARRAARVPSDATATKRRVPGITEAIQDVLPAILTARKENGR